MRPFFSVLFAVTLSVATAAADCTSCTQPSLPAGPVLAQLDYGPGVADIGLQGVNQPGFKNIQGAPNVSITGFTGFSLPGGGVVQDNHLYSYADSLTWSVGRHVMKFGGELKTI